MGTSGSEPLEARVLLTTDYVFTAASAPGNAAGNGVPDQFSIQNTGSAVQVYVNSTLVLNQPLVNIGTISINGSSDVDTVTVNPLNGLPSFVINGGVAGASTDVVTFQNGNSVSQMGTLNVTNVGTINVNQFVKAQSVAFATDKLFVGDATSGTAGNLTTTGGGAVTVTGGSTVSIGTSTSSIVGGNVTLKANSAASNGVTMNIAGTVSATGNVILRNDRLTDGDPLTKTSLVTTIQGTGSVMAAGSITSDSWRLDLLTGGQITSSGSAGITINTGDTGVYYGTIDAGGGGIRLNNNAYDGTGLYTMYLDDTAVLRTTSTNPSDAITIRTNLFGGARDIRAGGTWTVGAGANINVVTGGGSIPNAGGIHIMGVTVNAGGGSTTSFQGWSWINQPANNTLEVRGGQVVINSQQSPGGLGTYLYGTVRSVGPSPGYGIYFGNPNGNTTLGGTLESASDVTFLGKNLLTTAGSPTAPPSSIVAAAGSIGIQATNTVSLAGSISAQHGTVGIWAPGGFTSASSSSISSVLSQPDSQWNGITVTAGAAASSISGTYSTVGSSYGDILFDMGGSATVVGTLTMNTASVYSVIKSKSDVIVEGVIQNASSNRILYLTADSDGNGSGLVSLGNSSRISGFATAHIKSSDIAISPMAQIESLPRFEGSLPGASYYFGQSGAGYSFDVMEVSRVPDGGFYPRINFSAGVNNDLLRVDSSMPFGFNLSGGAGSDVFQVVDRNNSTLVNVFGTGGQAYSSGVSLVLSSVPKTDSLEVTPVSGGLLYVSFTDPKAGKVQAFSEMGGAPLFRDIVRFWDIETIVGYQPFGTIVAPDLSQFSDSGSSDIDNITNATTLSFVGSGVNGHTVRLYDQNMLVGTAVVSNGSYTIPVTSPWEGTHSYSIRYVSPTGFISAASSALSVLVDRTGPTAMMPPDLKTTSDSGSSSDDNITSVTIPTFEGTGVHGDTVFIYRAGTVEIGSGVVSGSNYSVTVTAPNALPDGLHSITARFKDLAGNLGGASMPLSVVIDSTAPTNITLSQSSVAENSAIHTTVGSFTTTDSNASNNSFAYALVPGTGSTDNTSFYIDTSP